MAWSVVQKRQKTPASGTSGALAFSAALTPGNTILVAAWASWGTMSTLSVADNQTPAGSYTPIINFPDNTNIQRLCIWTAPVGSGGTPTVTVTAAASAFGIGFDIVEVAGIATGSTSLDKSSTNSTGTSATAPTSNSTSATTAANELVFGAYGDPAIDTSLAAGTAAGYTDAGTTGGSGAQNGSGEYKDSGASGSAIAATWVSSSTPYAAIVAVLKLGIPADNTPRPGILGQFDPELNAQAWF